ncbi:MAG: hypothetical protein ABIA63_03425 [bacterium]
MKKKSLTGSTSLLLSSTLILFFLNNKEIAFLALSCIILGDASAAIIGKNYGKHKIGRKTLEGSAACLAICLLIFFCCRGFLQEITLLQGITCAFATALLELIPVRLDDNLYVPIFTGVLLKYI